VFREATRVLRKTIPVFWETTKVLRKVTKVLREMVFGNTKTARFIKKQGFLKAAERALKPKTDGRVWKQAG